ncbi:unnamed protein product [Kuraishia capsulata CBS 1993]|uniref:Uncharacterized protein n=1 Tax=Kuraishia capsulata CBS 1993 TaxID=1382522 RepID=W6MK57_9ASCO|nr:uncharacterized protein KUCA_T00002350001 [Kuraishia capsulata CBS 1993]CDK26378.1 unnamed protein product [Kuraishia capsulata CBS 1993]
MAGPNLSALRHHHFTTDRQQSTNFIESTVKLADGLRITSTISYSSVYGVPEIHLRLTLNEQLLFDPEATQHALSGITSSNSAFEPLIASITLKEHRFLGSTWFYIHPCDSGAFMDEAYTGDDSLQWLVLWASIYGRLAGL